MNLAFALVTAALMWFTPSTFGNVVLGALPFEPLGFVSGMTHRGLESENMREVGAFFILTCITSGFRGMLSKLVGKEPPRMPVEHQTPVWLQKYMKE